MDLFTNLFNIRRSFIAYSYALLNLKPEVYKCLNIVEQKSTYACQEIFKASRECICARMQRIEREENMRQTFVVKSDVLFLTIFSSSNEKFGLEQKGNVSNKSRTKTFLLLRSDSSL